MIWASAFLGFTDSDYDTGVALWRELTGYPLSPDRGFLGARRLASGPSGLQLDAHVPDVLAATEQVRGLGAKHWETESAFWAALTGWESQTIPGSEPPGLRTWRRNGCRVIGGI